MKFQWVFILMLISVVGTTSGVDYTVIGIEQGENYTYQIQQYRIYDNTDGGKTEITNFELLPDTFVGENDTFIITMINETVWENDGKHYIDIYLTIGDYTVQTFIQLGYNGSIISPIQWDEIVPIWQQDHQNYQDWAALLASRTINWTTVDEQGRIGFTYTTMENLTSLDGVITSINHKSVIYEPSTGMILEYITQAIELLTDNGVTTTTYEGIYSFIRIPNASVSEDDADYPLFFLPVLFFTLIYRSAKQSKNKN